MPRRIQVEILGDASSLEAALGKAQTKTSKFGHGLAIASKVAAGALLGLGIAAKIGFDEFSQSQKVAKQTQAVLKSTGDAANVTAGHINKLAQQLLNLSGVDDETIQAGENVLLTFRNIQNQAGRTNDVFDQATKATLDLSVAMGEDMHSAAIQVGKALNDPVKGLTALKRVGVQFTDAQTKLIKKLVATGNIAEAQKLILGELNQEFGGSAKAAGQTLSGQLGILREHFADVAASVVQSLMPALESLLGVLTSATDWMKKNQEATKLITFAIAGLATAVIVVNAAYKAWGAITKVVAAAQWVLNAALAGNPVVLITLAIIALGVALVVAYKKSATFRAVVNGAFNAVKVVAGAVVGFIRDHWKMLIAFIPVIGPALFLVITHLKTLRNVAGAVLGFVHDKWQTVANVIKSVWGWIQQVISAIGDLISKIEGIPSGILDKLGSVAGSVGGLFGHVAGGVGGGFGGHPVAVGGGGGRPIVIHTHVMLDRRELAQALQSYDKDYRRQNGRGLFA